MVIRISINRFPSMSLFSGSVIATSAVVVKPHLKFLVPSSQVASRRDYFYSGCFGVSILTGPGLVTRSTHSPRKAYQSTKLLSNEMTARSLNHR